MKRVKMTRRFAEVYSNYLNSWASDLYDVYNSFSQAKLEAYNYCRELQAKLNGEDFRIIGANTSQFSVGFEYNLYLENEVKRMFVYITAENNYEMEVL